MVKITSGIKDGQRIRLSGLGTEGRGGGEAEDLYLEGRMRVILWSWKMGKGELCIFGPEISLFKVKTPKVFAVADYY
jgi:hypothetical protein